jgi:DNA (cytosine-5)-methyltransferase 1
MTKLRVLDLFSGIGGFSLGLERTGGFETVAFCEIEPFPRRVLAKHWPGVPCYEDVRTLTGADVGPVDVICGGYPCQPFSTAGKREGANDDRHLWPEYLRLINELRPSWVIGENVAGHISLGLDQVLSDMEAAGYAARAFVIPAVAVNAPHRRDRVWIIGNANEDRKPACAEHDEARGLSGVVADAKLAGLERPTGGRLYGTGRAKVVPAGRSENVADANRHNAQGQQPRGIDPKERPRQITGSPGPRFAGDGGVWSVEPDVGRVAHGVPDRAHRLAALGNSVVPQIPELIGRAILEARA